MAGNNTDIMLVEFIENHCDLIQRSLKKIEPKTATEFEAKNEAREFMNLYQLNQVKKLRQEFE